MSTLVIINPHSGSVDDLSEVAADVRDHPALCNPEIRITGATGDARLLAEAGVENDFDTILVLGGDGTFNEVVNGVLGPPGEDVDPASLPMLGMIPGGTGNDLSRTLQIPRDLEDALDALKDSVPREMDVIRVSGSCDRWFVNASAGGFSGRVDEEVTDERKKSWGPLAYLRGAVDILPNPERYLAGMRVDGGEPLKMEILNAVVANARTVAGGIPIAPEALVDDGLMDIVLVRAAPLGELAGFGSRCLVGKHLEHELVHHVRARIFEIESEPTMPFNLDGELLARTPLRYEVHPRKIRVLVPENGASMAFSR